MRLTAILAILGVASIAWAQTPSRPSPAAQSKPEQFDTAEAAAGALIQAAANNDTAALKRIFGPAGQDVLTSGNSAQDDEERKEFSKMAAAGHTLEADPMNPNRMLLTLGEDDWPFPAPIVRTGGKWSFAPAEARVELRARQVGANELDVVEICMGYIDAQQQFAGKKSDPKGMQEYAQRAMSQPGKRDGLYWDDPNGGEPLVPKRFAEAVVDEVKARGASPRAYHGYYFRILKSQGAAAPGGSHHYVVGGHMIGGFGLAAWPAKYGVTGIETFVVNQDGVVYEKDLGEAKSGSITEFNPDSTWKVVD